MELPKKPTGEYRSVTSFPLAADLAVGNLGRNQGEFWSGNGG